MKTFDLANGVRLHYIENRKFKTASMSVYINRPLCKQDATKNALIPFVLKHGSAKYPSQKDISLKLEELYGASFNADIIKRGENQIIAFNLETISDGFTPDGSDVSADAMDTLCSIVFEPYVQDDGFLAKVVSAEKENLKDLIKNVINDKRTYAINRCFELMCSNEPYSIYEYGIEEDVDGICEKSLYSYYKEIIKHSAIDIFVSGIVDIEKIRTIVAGYTKGLLGGQHAKTIISSKTNQVRNFTDKFDVTQGKISLGLKTNVDPKSKDFYALVLGNSIFGSGPHSKLFNNVREKLSLCYYVFSRVERLKGLMIVSAGVEFDKFTESYDEILLQLDAVKNGNFTDEEFSAARLAVLNGVNSVNDSLRGMQDYIMASFLTGGDSVEDYIENINSVTRDDVVRAMSNITLDTVYHLINEA